ncbi:MAG: hypothetical protein MHPSP_000593 [Paramarteilia canceri]
MYTPTSPWVPKSIDRFKAANCSTNSPDQSNNNPNLNQTQSTRENDQFFNPDKTQMSNFTSKDSLIVKSNGSFEAELQIVELKKQKEALDSENEFLQRKLIDSNESIKLLKENSANILLEKNKVELSKKKLEQYLEHLPLPSAYKALSDKNDELNHEIEKLSRQVEQWQKLHSSKIELLNSIKSEKIYLQSVLEQEKGKTKDLTRKLSETSTENTQHISDLQSTIESLQQQNEKFKIGFDSTYEYFIQKAAKDCKSVIELKNHNSILHHTIDELKEKLEDRDNSVSTLKIKNAELKLSSLDAKNQIDGLLKENKEVKEQNGKLEYEISNIRTCNSDFSEIFNKINFLCKYIIEIESKSKNLNGKEYRDLKTSKNIANNFEKYCGTSGPISILKECHNMLGKISKNIDLKLGEEEAQKMLEINF